MPWKNTYTLALVSNETSDKSKTVVFNAAWALAEKAAQGRNRFCDAKKYGFVEVPRNSQSKAFIQLTEADRLYIVGHGDGDTDKIADMTANQLAAYLKDQGLSRVGLISLVSCDLGKKGAMAGFGPRFAINLQSDQVIIHEIRTRSGEVHVARDGTKHVYEEKNKEFKKTDPNRIRCIFVDDDGPY